MESFRLRRALILTRYTVFLPGLQVIRHYSEKQDYYRSICVHNSATISVGCMPVSFSSKRTRFDLLWTSVQSAIITDSAHYFLLLESATIPRYQPYSVRIMRFHETSEGGNRLHSDFTLLWYAIVGRVVLNH